MRHRRVDVGVECENRVTPTPTPRLCQTRTQPEMLNAGPPPTLYSVVRRAVLRVPANRRGLAEVS